MGSWEEPPGKGERGKGKGGEWLEGVRVDGWERYREMGMGQAKHGRKSVAPQQPLWKVEESGAA